MKIRFSAGGMATIIAGLGLAACQADRIDVPQSELYAREFIKQFGAVDPNQQWTLASRITANVDLSGLERADKVTVYNRMPGTEGCQMAAQFSASASSFEFDFPANFKMAYVQVTDANGISMFSGYIPVEGQTLDIVRRPGRSSRAGATGLTDLSDNKAIGYFPFSESYNSDFWKKYDNGKFYAAHKDDKRVTLIPDGDPIVTKTEPKTLFEGSQNLEGWNDDTDIEIAASEFSGFEGCDITVTFIPGDGTSFMLKNDWDEWNDTKTEASANEDEQSKTFSLNAERITELTGKGPLRIQGQNVTINKVVVQGVKTEQKYKEKYETATKLTSAFKLYSLQPDANYSVTFEDYNTAFSFKDIASLIGKGGVYHERVSEDGACNLKRHAGVFNSEKGVEYVVAENSKINLEYIYGATSYFNSFGYFYYREGASQDEIMRAPKIIAMFDASPNKNTIVMLNGNDATSAINYAKIGEGNGFFNQPDNSAHGMHWGGTACSDIITAVEEDKTTISGFLDNGNWADKTIDNPMLRSSTHYIKYYPYNHETGELTGEAQDEFPAKTHICFFVVTHGAFLLGLNDENHQFDAPQFSFSLPWMNKAIGNVYDSNHSHTAGNPMESKYVGDPDATDPYLSFVTYKWGKEIILGVEDGTFGGDHDENDILFAIRGNFETDDITEVVIPNVKAQSWILAGEDLGSSHDFDFNDIVVGISHISTDGEGADKATITAIAAGGTMPLKLRYKGEPIPGAPEYYHQWFGDGVSSSEIVNAHDFRRGIGQSYTISVDKNFSLGTTPSHGYSSLYDFSFEAIHSDGSSHTVANGEDNMVPQLILVPGTWKYPKECQHILDAYSSYHGREGFADWVKSIGSYNWYTSPINESIVIDHKWTGASISTDNQ